ncbi:MAG: thioredoxin domain-containing protein [Hyphomonadaceae bacterium]|nr:thioredoxin domain-containing protein [Hyphomonadaceae bacterium]
MRRVLTLLVLSIIAALPVQAEPVLKVINFTADWCPNCQILNPRLDRAIDAFEAGSIERVDLDVTAIRRNSSRIERAAVETDALMLAGEHKAAYLWDWYGGITGIAVAIAADTGEPITCFMRPMKKADIEDRLRLAKILAERAKPGNRKPEGPDCPAPMRG